MEPILERRSVRLTLLIVIALAFLVFVYLLRDIFAPLVTGFLLAYMLDPLADFLERRRFSRAAAVATIYLVAALLAATVFFFGSFYVASGVYSAVNKIRGDRLFEHVDLTKIQDPKPNRHFEDRDGDGRYDEGYLVQAERWFRKHLSEDPLWEIRFAATQEWFNDKFRGYENPMEHEQELKDRTKEQLNVAWAWLWSRPEGDVGRAPTSQEQGQGGSAMFTLLSWFLLCPLYVFFFLLQIDAIIATSREYMPGRARPTIERLFGEIDETLSAFFRGRLMICLLKGSLTAVGLFIFGVPFWLPLGLAAGFLALIPYVGVYLALIPALFLCWFEHHSWMLMAGTLGAFGF
ncbi:MAG: AI-2E family transporter, partial [Planctomycetota bacterium]